MNSLTPANYERWYGTARGRWIAGQEYRLIRQLMGDDSASVLEVGSGTGHFGRMLAEDGFQLVALDPDLAMLGFAATRRPTLPQVAGSALALPFADNSFDCVLAITSLCFVEPPHRALAEMWRVSRHSVIVGLLNRHSLLYRWKAGKGGYRGARWDSRSELRKWLTAAGMGAEPSLRSAVFFPTGGEMAQWAEQKLSPRYLWGSFLGVGLRKS